MIVHGDCLEVMKRFPDNYIDFICCDPPYGLNFMGKKWDSAIPNSEIWSECLRICKPGSMLAAFGGSRTHHHLMMALEQAGWEIRDVIMYLYGQGFPKSHNKFGLDGYGTALKPAYEPIIICMKPLDGTYAQNVEKWDIGGINIDDSRIEGNKRKVGCINPGKRSEGSSEWNKSSLGKQREVDLTKGRWPANIILDEEAGVLLDHQSGILKSGHLRQNINTESKNNVYGKKKCANVNEFKSSTGGASRFFYCAKASSKERGNENHHPTVKPISLMRYIIKLLAPPNNPVLLDPFCGSGSTLIAAKELGIEAIGIEREEDYCEIAKKRVQNF